MRSFSLASFKPSVKKSVHYFLSGLLWTCMGALILWRGIFYITSAHLSYLLLAFGIILGVIKSFVILDKCIKKALVRIENLPPNSCLGAVYSIQNWGIIIIMMTAGIVLRHSFLPAQFLAVFCCTIGWALLFSSRHGWRRWWSNRI